MLCPQEPDQVYEGITFDDFLKVGVWEKRGWCWCAAVRGLQGQPAGQEEAGISAERGHAWTRP